MSEGKTGAFVLAKRVGGGKQRGRTKMKREKVKQRGKGRERERRKGHIKCDMLQQNVHVKSATHSQW